MKFLSTSITFAFCLASIGGLENNADFNSIVTKAIQEATEYHDKLVLDATVRGAFSTSKSRGIGNTKSSPYSEEVSRISNIYKTSLEILVNKHGMTRYGAAGGLNSNMPGCQQFQPNCNSNLMFRNFDGTCNNLRNVFWGSANQPYVRTAANAYEDGFDVPRGGHGQSSRLPNPRLISTLIHPDTNVVHPTITNMVPQFGQFLDHDITLTAVGSKQCCGAQQNDPDCFAISIPTNDSFYSQRISHPQTCMEFTRSVAFCFSRTFGIREQMNLNTAFVDGSQIYGSAITRTTQLRTMSGGLLKTNNEIPGFLPKTSSVDPSRSGIGTFIAGDDRINEMPSLAAIHNLFLKEHNRIATQIRQVRRTLTDEYTFHYTRRIVSAQLQQITYGEYLPLVLGSSSMNAWLLNVAHAGYSSYDPNNNPTIINAFATAAYRFGHSLVGGTTKLVNNGNLVGTFNLRDNYGQSRQLTQSNGQGYDWLLGGLMTQNSQQSDPFVSEDVTNFLLKSENSDFGSDLVARNIQRGRDHGLPSYNTYRRVCGLPVVSSWASPPLEIRNETWARLQEVYTSFNDIDLFTGGLVETPVSDGLIGPTFNCIISAQFHRLKSGDRFFYTHGGQAGSFTPVQLAQLRARTLGDIICENSRQDQTQKNVFLRESSSNPSIRCDDPSRTKINVVDFV